MSSFLDDTTFLQTIKQPGLHIVDGNYSAVYDDLYENHPDITLYSHIDDISNLMGPGVVFTTKPVPMKQRYTCASHTTIYNDGDCLKLDFHKNRQFPIKPIYIRLGICHQDYFI